jgi:hypothetical protein
MADKLTPAQIQQAEKNASAEGFLHRVAVAADQELNVDSGGLPDETISSRVRRISDAHSRWSWNPGVWLAKTLNAGLNVIQRNHGQMAESGDLERALTVAATEQTALDLSAAAPRCEPVISASADPGTARSCYPERSEGSLFGVTHEDAANAASEPVRANSRRAIQE